MDNLNVMDKQFDELCREEDRFQALFNSITDALLVHWVETDETRALLSKLMTWLVVYWDIPGKSCLT